MDWISCKVGKTLANSPTVRLPIEDGHVKTKTDGTGSYIVVKTGSKPLPEEICCKKCKEITRPKSATAKRFTIDLIDHNYSEIALTFGKSEELNKSFDALAAVVGESATKKVHKSSLTQRMQPPDYQKPAEKTSNTVAPSQKYMSTLTTTPSRTNARAPLSEPIQQIRSNSRQTTSLHSTQPGSSTEPNFFTQTVRQSNNTHSPVSRKRYHKNQDEDNPYGYARANDDENAVIIDSKKQKRIDDELDKYPPYKEMSPERVKPTSYRKPQSPMTKNSVFNDLDDIKEEGPPDNSLEIASPKFSNTKLSTYEIYRHRCMANLGNSCYMNASLQALASLPQFITELLKAVPEEKYRVDKQPKRSDILHAVANVFDHVFSAPQKKIAKIKSIVCRQEVEGPVPRELLKAVRQAAGSQIDRSMGESTQHDAQEFLSRVLEIIEEEIDGKKPDEQEERPSSDKENYSCEDVNGITTVPPAKQKIEENSAFLPSFINIFTKPKPLINPGSLFKTTCYNRLVCNDCGYVLKKEETDREVQLGMGSDEPSIADLIRMQFERHDISWKCTECGSTRASMSTSFKELPEYLIIVLKRYGYEEGTGGNKSTETVKVDRDLHLQMLCEGSEHKTKELEKVPQPQLNQNDKRGENEGNLEDGVDCVPESPELTPLLRNYPKGFKSPVKSVSRELFPKTKLDDVGSQDSQRSNSIFGDDEEIDKETSIKVEDECNNDHTPEPTKETLPSSPDAIADKLAGSNVFPKVSEDDPYNYVDSLRQSGGAVLHVENKNRLSKAHLESCDSEDNAIVVGVKKADSILWKPLTPSRIWHCQQHIDKHLCCDSTLETVTEWAENTLDNQARTIPMHLSRRAFQKQSVEGDGACLFRCFSWWLCEGSQEHHDIMRGKVCDFIERFDNEFSALAGKNWNGYDNVKDYLNFMRQNDVWASHIEISAMATLLQCTIYSYHKNNWKRFPPKFKCITKQTYAGEKFEKLEGEVTDDTGANGAMYIYNSGNHFDPVFAIYDEALMDFIDTEQEHSESPMDFELDTNDCATPPAQVSDHEDEKIDTVENISPGPYIYDDRDGPVYTLSAVVNHKGIHLNHGHYTAYSFDADRNTWLSCDDSSVNVISENVVLNQSMSSGYLFIYRRRHPNDEAQFTH